MSVMYGATILEARSVDGFSDWVEHALPADSGSKAFYTEAWTLGVCRNSRADLERHQAGRRHPVPAAQHVSWRLLLGY